MARSTSNRTQMDSGEKKDTFKMSQFKQLGINVKLFVYPKITFKRVTGAGMTMPCMANTPCLSVYFSLRMRVSLARKNEQKQQKRVRDCRGTSDASTTTLQPKAGTNRDRDKGDRREEEGKEGIGFVCVKGQRHREIKSTHTQNGHEFKQTSHMSLSIQNKDMNTNTKTKKQICAEPFEVHPICSICSGQWPCKQTDVHTNHNNKNKSHAPPKQNHSEWTNKE